MAHVHRFAPLSTENVPSLTRGLGAPSKALNIAAAGVNEHFSGVNAGTMFGDGVYFAEDMGKSDQYCAPHAAAPRDEAEDLTKQFDATTAAAAKLVEARVSEAQSRSAADSVFRKASRGGVACLGARRVSAFPRGGTCS